MTAPTIRPMTERVALSLVLDAALSVPERTDFGIATDDHCRALRAALDGTFEQLDEAAELEQLDGVLGNGSAITAFVRQYAPEWSQITFTTPFDDLLRAG